MYQVIAIMQNYFAKIGQAFLPEQVEVSFKTKGTRIVYEYKKVNRITGKTVTYKAA